jgi:replicative DNA helicase
VRQEDVARFVREIGIFGKERAVAKALRIGSRKRPKVNLDVIPVEVWSLIERKKGARTWADISRALGFTEKGHNLHVGTRGLSRPRLRRIAEVLGDAELANLATSDIYWDRIESIEYVGERQVYDLTVPQYHNFVAEDIVVHNTSLAINIAENAALGHKVPAAIFSMEMSAEQLSFRMLSSIGRIGQQRLRTGKLHDEDWPRVDSAVAMMSEAPIFIDDSGGLTPTEVRARARRLKREHGLGLIVVDYLQLMQVTGTVENRATELSEISRSLKALAKELDVPVIALSQLNRGVEQRQDKRPVMSDLRECVTGETLVCLADGRRVPIRDLVGTEPDVWSIDENQRVTCSRADKVWRVGRRSVFRIALASGRTIRATAEHRLLAGQGWTTVSELRVGDPLALSRAHALDVATGGTRRHVRAYGNTALAAAVDHLALPEDAEIATAAESDLLWDRVVALTPDGEEDVYDLTVPGPANWLANGIITHNSGALEQDADLILLIYREEVYEKDTPRKGIADIIVAKQRNGPVGEFRLTFLGEFTKFENLVAEAYGEGVF